MIENLIPYVFISDRKVRLINIERSIVIATVEYVLQKYLFDILVCLRAVKYDKHNKLAMKGKWKTAEIALA